jgi:hypothetical protein
MQLKPITKMADREFDNILDQIGDNDPDVITLPDFMETLWALRSNNVKKVIELTAKLIDDHIEIQAPEGVAVRGNEVILGNHRIILRWANA